MPVKRWWRLLHKTAIIGVWDRNHRRFAPRIIARDLTARAHNHCHWAHNYCHWAHTDCTAPTLIAREGAGGGQGNDRFLAYQNAATFRHHNHEFRAMNSVRLSKSSFLTVQRVI